MEANSLDDFHLAPPGWSDSSQPESNDHDTNVMPSALLEVFLCDIGTNTSTVQPALPRRFTQPKPDEDVEKAKEAASKHKHPQ